MKFVISPRARLRIFEASDYIAQHFYAEYADAFETDVWDTIKRAAEKPETHPIAFPALDRSEIRRILCGSRRHFVYYRIQNDTVEVLSVMHTLQEVNSPADL